MCTDCLEALKKSFHVFVIFHLVTILAQTHFKETLFHFCWRNQQKGDIGDFGWEASFIPLRLVLFSASVIFLLICPKLIALSLLDNAFFSKRAIVIMTMAMRITMTKIITTTLPHEQVQSEGIRQLQGIVPLCTRDFTLDPSYNYNLDDDFMILLWW